MSSEGWSGAFLDVPGMREPVVRIGDVLQFEGRRVRVVDIVPLPAGTVIAVKDVEV